MKESNRALIRLCRRVFEAVDPVFAEARILAEVSDDAAEGDVDRIAQQIVDSTPEKYRAGTAQDAASHAAGGIYERIRRDAAARRAVEERRERTTGADRLGVRR